MSNPSGHYNTSAARRAALIEDVEFLTSCNVPAQDIPARVGYRSMITLKKQLQRLGRNDLATALGESGPRRKGYREGHLAGGLISA